MTTARRHNRNWTKEEHDYLVSEWGEKTPDAIARELGRTTTAVRVRAKQFGLGPYRDSSEYLTKNQVTTLMGVDCHVIERTWIPKYKLPVHYKRIAGKQRFKVISVSELLRWMKKNPEAYDATKIKEYALGVDPDWLKEKRKADKTRTGKPGGKRYTASEDIAIIRGCRAGLSYRQIGEQIGRSADSVQNRAYRIDFSKYH